MLKYLLLLPCTLAGIISLSAQPKPGSIAGRTHIAQPVAGGQSLTGISGVVVEACMAKDTLYTTTLNGYFQFKKIPAGRVTLRFSHVSYKEVTREVEVKAGETTEVEIRMQEASQEIETVTVKGEIPVLTIKGDTLVYNAAAVQTLEGDETMRIVEQLPGVQTGEAGVSVMGKNIERTYIDGKLIFGHDPMAALQNLLANDVVKIRVYDEYMDQDPRHKRRKGDEMRRVFNIETKSKLIQATTGHFLASYGADLNEGGRGNHDRYGIGATANFFSESLLLSANAFFNNINRKTNRIADIIAAKSPKTSYDRTTYINAGFERNWESKRFESSETTLRASYIYGNDYTRSDNTTEQTYFPSSDYTSRLYADTLRNTMMTKYHEANLYFSFPIGVYVTHYMRFADDRTDGYRSYASVVDGGTPVGGRTRSLDKRSRYDISDDLQFQFYPFQIGIRSYISNDDGRGFRTDTLTSTSTRRELRSTSLGLSRKIEASFSGSIGLSKEKANYLHYSYSYKWDKSRQQKTSLDLADLGNPAIDTANTYNFTNNYNTHEVGIELGLSFPKIKSGLNIGSVFSTTGVNRDEKFPENDAYDKRFNAFMPSFLFSCGNMVKRLSVSYMTYTQLPSIEQLRPYLDDTNPYMLVAGNRRLKQSYVHNFRSSYGILFGKANNRISISLNARRTDDLIAYKRTFFSQDTRLPEWNYTAPAQSTLTTYENVGGMWNVDASIEWGRPFRKLKSQLTVTPAFNYDDTPSFVDNTLSYTRNYAPKLSLNWRADISRSFRFTVRTHTSYVYSKNNINQDDRYFRQGVSVNPEWVNLFKRFYLSAVYSFSYYKRFGVNAYDLNDQILNMSVGCKVLKRRGDISFTVYDLLNRNSGYKTAMFSNYVQNTWTRSFGRYFTFNIAYKFNHSKSGVTNDGVKEGDVPYTF